MGSPPATLTANCEMPRSVCGGGEIGEMHASTLSPGAPALTFTLDAAPPARPPTVRGPMIMSVTLASRKDLSLYRFPGPAPHRQTTGPTSVLLATPVTLEHAMVPSRMKKIDPPRRLPISSGVSLSPITALSGGIRADLPSVRRAAAPPSMLFLILLCADVTAASMVAVRSCTGAWTAVRCERGRLAARSAASMLRYCVATQF